MERREGSEGKSHKEEEREGGSGMGSGTGGRALFGCPGVPDNVGTQLLMGVSLPTKLV